MDDINRRAHISLCFTAAMYLHTKCLFRIKASLEMDVCAQNLVHFHLLSLSIRRRASSPFQSFDIDTFNKQTSLQLNSLNATTIFK